ncbi:MAG: hypothetical protein R3E01_00030 [Pirellulaceae bacterium]|nr:hypothetical protein [Planctomycetales bacterium]
MNGIRTSLNVLLRVTMLGLAWLTATVPADGQNLLINGSMDVPNAPLGWDLLETANNPEIGVTNSAEAAGFAAQSGGLGLWLREFQGLFIGNGNEQVNAVLSQTVPGTPGESYTFSGWSFFEENYSGGVDVLAPESPSGEVASSTQTMMELAFLDASGTVIGTPVTLDLRTVQSNTETWMQHMLNGVAPAGTTDVRVSASAIDMVANVDPAQSAFYDNFSLTTASAPNTQLLSNNDLEEWPEATLDGWDFAPGSPVEYIDFAAHSGTTGLWVRSYEGFPGPIDAVVTQTVAAEAGKNYEFSGWSYFEAGYPGGVDNLDPAAPLGNIPSPTQTYFEMEFLDSSGQVIGDPVLLDLRTVQMNDETWRKHALQGLAPEGTAEVRVSIQALQLVENVDIPFQTANFDEFSLVVLTPNDLLGDYNRNGVVDAADYTVWKDNFGSSTELAADGNGNGLIDAADYTVWKDNFGNAAGNAVSSMVPEPASGLAALVGMVICLAYHCRSVRRRCLE